MQTGIILCITSGLLVHICTKHPKVTVAIYIDSQHFLKQIQKGKGRLKIKNKQNKNFAAATQYSSDLNYLGKSQRKSIYETIMASQTETAYLSYTYVPLVSKRFGYIFCLQIHIKDFFLPLNMCLFFLGSHYNYRLFTHQCNTPHDSRCSMHTIQLWPMDCFF